MEVFKQETTKTLKVLIGKIDTFFLFINFLKNRLTAIVVRILTLISAITLLTAMHN